MIHFSISATESPLGGQGLINNNNLQVQSERTHDVGNRYNLILYQIEIVIP